MSVIDDFLSKIEPEKRKELERIRRIAKQTVLDAKEVIRYGMPTLTHNGKPFLGFNTHKHHIGIYPYGAEPIAVFQNELMAFQHSSGAIRVPYGKAFPEELLIKIIQYKIRKIDTKG